MTRIQLSHKAEAILRIEAAIEGMKPSALLEQLIFNGVKSDQARSMITPIPPIAFHEKYYPQTFDHSGQIIAPRAIFHADKNQNILHDYVEQDKTPESPKVQFDKMVKDAWGRGIKSQRKIAEAINSNKTAVGSALDRLRAAGEIKE